MEWLSSLREGFSFLLPLLEALPGFRAMLGLLLVFFLPGFAWTLVFFRQINVLERIAVSVGLSIVIVALSILALNKLVGLRITSFNSVLVIVLVTIIPLAFYYLNRLRQAR